MTFRLSFRPAARADLIELHAWVEHAAGASVADAYQRRIHARCSKLTEFPHRGTPRDKFAPGLRSVSFERRLIIFYRVTGDVVSVVRILHGARDLQALLVES